MSLFVFIASVGVWLGMVVSYTFVFLPAIRDTLSSSLCEVLLPRLQLRYNLIGILCGLTALAAVSLAPPAADLAAAQRLRLAFPVSVALLCTLIMQYFVSPRMAQERDTASSAADERLHRAAALLDLTILAMLLLTVAAVATR